MTRPTQVTIAVLVVLGVVLLPPSIRAGMRIYGLQKFFAKAPGAKARLAVMPKKRTLTSLPVVHEVDLGYAIFDTGSTDPVSLEEVGSAAVVVHDGDARLVFLPPFGFDPTGLASISADNSRKHPHTIDFQRLMATDPVAALLQVEETCPLPAAKVLRMSNDDFLLYTFVLGQKGSQGWGANEVQYFESHNAKGIVLIGESPADRHVAGVQLSSMDGMIKIGCRVTMPQPSSRDIADVVDPIIRSFRFKIDKVEDREAIKALIRGAGIPRKAVTPEIDAENGQESLR